MTVFAKTHNIADFDNAYNELQKKKGEYSKQNKEFKDLQSKNVTLLTEFNILKERTDFLESQNHKSGKSLENYSKQVFELEEIVKQRNKELNSQVNKLDYI